MKILSMSILRQMLQKRLEREDQEDPDESEIEWRVGQLFFDPAGEYANPNPQDERSISELPSEIVSVYRWGETADESGAYPLQLNFFDRDLIRPVWSTVRELLTRDADYVDDFKAANVIGPDRSEDWGGATRAKRCRSAFYATLIKAGFEPPEDFTSWISVDETVINAVNKYYNDGEEIEEKKGRFSRVDSSGPDNLPIDHEDLVDFWEAVYQKRKEINKNYADKKDANVDWTDEDLISILRMLTAARGSGYRLLKDLQKYHNPDSEGFYGERIYRDLTRGQIVVVDLSIGTEDAIQVTSERIVRYILNQSISRFTADKRPHNIQIYLEEAHQLFDREHMEDAESDDPYVRLAKEAAKYKIGLTYATQEVTGVDRRVLANTANWVVTHLNNDKETNRLSDYYNFDDFERAIKRTDDVGYARIKTLSNNYIVPTQIDFFNESQLRNIIKLYNHVEQNVTGPVLPKLSEE